METRTRIRFIIGSGGVGKTTTATIAAMALSEQVTSIHLLTIDPSLRLKTALGLKDLGIEPQDVLLPNGKTLKVHGVSPQSGFDRLIGDQNPALLVKLQTNPIYMTLTRLMAGTHEYVAWLDLGKIIDQYKPELIIVDTPPSNNLTDFLNAPERAMRFWEERVQKIFLMGKDVGGGILSNALVGGVMNAGFKILESLLGGTFYRSVMELVESLNSVRASILQKFKNITSTIRDPQYTQAWWVTTSEQLLHGEWDWHQQLNNVAITTSIVNRDWSQLTTDNPNYSRLLKSLDRHRLPGRILRLPDQAEAPTGKDQLWELSRQLIQKDSAWATS